MCIVKSLKLNEIYFSKHDVLTFKYRLQIFLIKQDTSIC